MTLTWIDGQPTEPGPYWLKLKYNSGFIETVMTEVEKTIPISEYNSIDNDTKLFCDYGDIDNNDVFEVIQYCPIPKPKG
jgi:hypothetical protein